MSKNIKIAIAACAILAAILILVWTYYPEDAPGAGKPAEVHLANGQVIQTTWEEVYERQKTGKAVLLQTENGGWLWKTDEGAWGRIISPGQAVKPLPANLPD